MLSGIVKLCYTSVSWISVTRRFMIAVLLWPSKFSLQFGSFTVLCEATQKVGRVLFKSSPKISFCCFSQTFPDEYGKVTHAHVT
jgi:hypothetical protein